MKNNEQKEILKTLKLLSSDFNYGVTETAIILAAGHGKRIKSQRSKMLHKIWEVPTVERVFNACKGAASNMNVVVVVGIKAKDVMEVVGKREQTIFAYQDQQNGTGHAVKVALDNIDSSKYDGHVYVLPGDMGLIDKQTMTMFREEFIKSNSDMMVLTGLYDGDPKDNNYGRIIRVKDVDAEGKSSNSDYGKVIVIMEHKDILALSDDKPYEVIFNGRKYSYTKQELIDNNEFNSSVYAFKYKKLVELIPQISSNNVQTEIYLTDLIALFNKKNYSVLAVSPLDQYVVMGFNNKSVLKDMENIARKKVYEKLKDIVEIADPDDFFIHEDVVEEILEQDRKGTPLDIIVGKGSYIGKGVKLNYNLELKEYTYINGNVDFAKNVNIYRGVHLSCFEGQTLKVGENVQILWGDIIKGNIEIGESTRIESSVNMTGSDEFPLRIGKNVLIKGTSYLFGCIVEDDVHIEHSVIIRKRVEKILKRDGTIQIIKYILPQPEGIDAIEEL
ncbi:MAG TPA: NTP transferase domain-containing protein [Ignavibacteriaceae bacterium]|nr:NTP transferase domain-containing protein [Ignavibacteriaceae bacterium]